MNDTVLRLRRWWQARAPRERAMLALMAALLAAFTWWYGLLWPLRSLYDAAQARHDHAATALQAVEAEVAALGGHAGARSAAPGGEALQRLVLDSARDAGLAPSRQRTTAEGAFVVEFDRAASPALFGWLGGLVEARGVAPSTLHVERADGQVHAVVGFGGGAAP